jgi:hypothetical protein
MDLKVVNFLRNSAQECIRIARHCPDVETNYALEDLAVSLMQMAEEIEKAYRQC